VGVARTDEDKEGGREEGLFIVFDVLQYKYFPIN
jgi:hypothetical protein